MITPLDIKRHEFAERWRGYDKDEVHALLETVAKDFEEMVRQNTHLSERIKVVEERLNHYRLMEKTLQDAVMTMQGIVEEKRRVAEQEAEIIVQQARQRAEAELVEYRSHLGSLKGEILSLESQKHQFFIRFKGMLRSQTEMMDALLETDEGGRRHEEWNPAAEDYRHASRPATIPHQGPFVRGDDRA